MCCTLNAKHKLPVVSKAARRKYTPYKPYWNADLSALWKSAHEKHTIYVRFKGPNHTKNVLKRRFADARDAFDKLLRKRKRAYSRGLLIDIEDCNTNDPRKFWNHINKLGPDRRHSIPWEVYDEDGNVSYDKNTVLLKWEEEYRKLFNDNSGSFDEEFYTRILDSKAHIERNMLDPLYTPNYTLNKPISMEEVHKAVDKTKPRKAAGTDNIPNEVLKNETVMKCLQSLFQMCFDYGIIPSTVPAEKS